MTYAEISAATKSESTELYPVRARLLCSLAGASFQADPSSPLARD